MAYWGEVEIIQGAQNIAENYTTVTANFYAVSDKGSAWRNATTYAGCTLDGTYQDVAVGNYNFGNNKRLLLGSITKNVYHNSDGTKIVSASFTWNSGHSLIGTVTGSNSLALTTIPRTSTVSCNSFNIGDSTTIVINRASANFTHTVRWTFGSVSGIIATKTSNIVIAYNFTKSTLYSQIPNSKSGVGTITCYTYSGDTLIGTSSCQFTAYAKETECVPSVSATIVDTNDTTIGLTGNSSKFIKGFSNAKVTITATAKNSSTISSTTITTGDGRTSSTSTDTFNNIMSNAISVQATDSRGYSSKKDYALNWIDYVFLAFTILTVERPESTSDTANISVKGNYFNASFGKESNSLSVQYRVKKGSEDYSNWETLTPTKSGNTFTASSTLSGLSHNDEYTFQFQISDKLMTVVQEVVLTKGIPVLRVGKDYVELNGMPILEYDIVDEW